MDKVKSVPNIKFYELYSTWYLIAISAPYSLLPFVIKLNLGSMNKKILTDIEKAINILHHAN